MDKGVRDPQEELVFVLEESVLSQVLSPGLCSGAWHNLCHAAALGVAEADEAAILAVVPLRARATRLRKRRQQMIRLSRHARTLSQGELSLAEAGPHSQEWEEEALLLDNNK